jgi:hypothetical protein
MRLKVKRHAPMLPLFFLFIPLSPYIEQHACMLLDGS